MNNPPDTALSAHKEVVRSDELISISFLRLNGVQLCDTEARVIFGRRTKAPIWCDANRSDPRTYHLI